MPGFEREPGVPQASTLPLHYRHYEKLIKIRGMIAVRQHLGLKVHGRSCGLLGL